MRKKGNEVGSLLLGLYNEEGKLDHVGFTSGFADIDRHKLTKQLEKLRKPPGFTGKAPGGPSRWSTERTGEWEPLAPKLVAEVRYDHISGDRFRHGTKFLALAAGQGAAAMHLRPAAARSESGPFSTRFISKIVSEGEMHFTYYNDLRRFRVRLANFTPKSGPRQGSVDQDVK